MTGEFHWDTSRALIMGVLNVTPDSFSDGGKFLDVDRAIVHAREMAKAGADIIDVGGESSRPGAAPVSAEEELRRVLPVVEHLRDLVVSVDTTKAVVAEKTLASGARIVNDISALQSDPQMVDVVRDAGAGVVLMHMQGTPQTMQQKPRYEDVFVEVSSFLRERVAYAEARGLKKTQIAVDPGIGFGKTKEDNLRLLAHLGEFSSLGCPLLVGTSRKSFIGKVLGALGDGKTREAESRLWGTAGTVAWAVAHGARILRVHDVAEMSAVVRMVEAIQQAR
jgi:dihydropteroate synthase